MMPGSPKIAQINNQHFEKSDVEEIVLARKVLLELSSEMHKSGFDISGEEILRNAPAYWNHLNSGKDIDFEDETSSEAITLFNSTIRNVLEKTNNPYLKVDLTEVVRLFVRHNLSILEV